jgi:hypothetical protein
MHNTVCRSNSAIFDSIIELPRTRYSSILIALDQVTVCGHITCENFSSMTIECGLGVRQKTLHLGMNLRLHAKVCIT